MKKIVCCVLIELAGISIGYGIAVKNYPDEYKNQVEKNKALYDANETLKINYDDLEIDLTQRLNKCMKLLNE